MDIFRFNTYAHIVNILFSIVTITNALIFFYCLRVHRRVFGLYDDWEHIHKPRYVNRYFFYPSVIAVPTSSDAHILSYTAVAHKYIVLVHICGIHMECRDSIAMAGRESKEERE